MKTILDHIASPADVKRLSPGQLPQLARELREFIIDVVATKEGHLGASLGVVELTIALHYVFNTPEDQLIWDVGHQAYGHKILTGRKDRFDTNRQLGGISGFPKRSESPHDAFGTGHSSTSISAILGMAMAAKLQHAEDRQHIAVIGDASIASGMAFEGLNHLGVTDTNVLIVLNDNAIGIDPSVGALKKYLTNVKKGTAKEENLFECLNLDYTGPMDGHDLPALVRELQRLKTVKGPKLLHLITTKGKGLKKAEENQVVYHAPGKFNRLTGEITKGPQRPQPPKFQDVFGETLVELAQGNERIVGITPAMPTGSSLRFMMDAFPNRAFDVGIAEQHAVTLAAGMATAGLVPFCTIYSTFLQRAYDQVIHDVALQRLPVVFCLDRAGLVGADGPTHHGVFDIAFLRCIPNMVLHAPMDEASLRNIMYTAQLGLDRPLAIRYPRGRGNTLDWRQPFEKLTIGKARERHRGNHVALLSHGAIGQMGTDIVAAFEKGKVGHYDFSFAKPLDMDCLGMICSRYQHLITLEDGVIAGGFGSAVLEAMNALGTPLPLKIFGVADAFVEHGTQEELYALNGMDKQHIIEYISHIHE
ncbi:1-deoxy-D-xylulose-5-phosphate synthase [Maribacter sp. 2307ULW6-5]|uniref:1-deoxy-D-xylulose-5-phosphate synthase n=1 Tax=Maribacter sp. 2307ULW6-5 TaxID=3386275 RepID=UPI0039BC7F98